MCWVTWTCEIHLVAVCINDLLMQICLFATSSLMSIENCNSPGLHKCESDCFVTGSGVSLWKRVSVCLEMSTSAGKKGFQSPPHRNSTSRRKPSRPVSASVHKPFNLLFLLLWTKEPCHDLTKNPVWCSIDVHDLKILCCCEMLMSKYYTIPRKGVNHKFGLKIDVSNRRLTSQ